MELAPWQQEHLATLAPVTGASIEDVRVFVAAMAFCAARDEDLVEAFLRITDTSPNIGATMFGLGIAVGHATEANVRRNPHVIDLRPALPELDAQPVEPPVEQAVEQQVIEPKVVQVARQVVNPLSSAPAGKPAVGTMFVPNQRGPLEYRVRS